MEFSTERERALHPQAGLIPPLVWRKFFNKKLTKQDIFLLNNDPETSRHVVKNWVGAGFCKPFLCILYRTPKITADDYISLLSNNRKLIQYATQAAAIAGRVDILKLISQREKPSFKLIIESNNFEIIQEVIRYSTFSMIKYMIQAYTGKISILLRADQFGVFRALCRRTDLKCKIFNYLLAQAPELQEEIITNCRFEVFKVAANEGNLFVLKLLVELAPHLVDHMLSANNYDAFAQAASSGKIPTLKYLISLAPEKARIMLRADDYQACINASMYGNARVLDFLSRLVPSELHNIVRAHDYRALTWGKLCCVKYLVRLMPKELEYMGKEKFFQLFQAIVDYGEEDVVMYFLTLKPHYTADLIRANNYAVFREQARKGRINAVKRLISMAPHLSKEMIRADNYYSFRESVRHASLELIDYLISLDSEGLVHMISANNYEAFSHSADRGRLDVLKHLVSLVPNHVQEMLAANNYLVLRYAVGSFHETLFEVTKYLVTIAGSKAKTMILADDYAVFYKISDLKVFKYLISLVPEHTQQIICSNNYKIFEDAVLHKRLDILEYLVRIAPEHIPGMVSANEFDALRIASGINPDTEVIRFLITIAPDTDEMIEAALFQSFAWGVEDGLRNPLTMEYLIELAPLKLKAMICANQCLAFRRAVKGGNLPALKTMFDVAPAEIVLCLQTDKEVMKTAIKKEHLHVVEFLVSCSDNKFALYPLLFIYPEGPYMWTDKEWRDEEFYGSPSKVFFENPLKLRLDTIHYLIGNFLSLGYFEIAKALIFTFSERSDTDNLSFITEVLMNAHLYPEKLDGFMTFLIDIMKWDKVQLTTVVSLIAADSISEYMVTKLCSSKPENKRKLSG